MKPKLTITIVHHIFKTLKKLKISDVIIGLQVDLTNLRRIRDVHQSTAKEREHI